MAKILVVEDDTGSREYFHSVLRATGHDVLAAVDGLEGWQMMPVETPDLVITDILMPRMDGYELCRRIRNDADLRKTKIILVTATYSLEEASTLGRAVGVFATLSKPLEAEDLLRVVSEALTDRRVPAIALNEIEFERKHLELISGKLSLKTRLATAGHRLQESLAFGNLGSPDQTPEDLLNGCANTLVQFVGGHSVSVALIHGETLRWVGGRDPFDKTRAEAERILLREVLLLSSQRLRTVRFPSSKKLFEENAGTLAGLPLIAATLATAQGCYGVILIKGTSRGGEFTGEDESIAGCLAIQISLAYENLIKRYEAQQRSQSLQCEIEEKERLTEQLRLSDEILRRVGSLVLVADGTGAITYASPSLSSSLGFEPQQVLGESWWRLTRRSENEATATMENVAKIARGEVSPLSVPHEALIMDASRAERSFLWQDTPGPNGTVIKVGQEVTALKQAQQDVRIWKERYENAIKTTRLILFEWDRITGEIVYGGSVEELLGYTAEELAAAGEKGWADLVHPDDLANYSEALAKSKLTGTPFSLQYRVRTKTGDYLLVRADCQQSIADSGSPNRFVGFVADVTERHELEEKLRQAQKMEAVGMLAGGVAHDFNNILNVILGHSELLLGMQATEDPAKCMDVLKRRVTAIHKATERAISLTSQLLSFSRKQVLQPVVTDPNEIVRETEKLLLRTIGENIRLRCKLDSSVDRVQVDPAQLQSVILNLAINARDAMPKGGELLISTENIYIDEGHAKLHATMTAGDHILLSVSDTGFGMDEETKKRIFEPFFTTKGQGKGTGLGLSSVYGIVKQSGGSIWVYSEPGCGTTFKIYLPKAASAEVPAEMANDPGPTKRTILLAEDVDDARQLLTEVLTENGYNVLSAKDGAEALALAAGTKSIDILITDVIMPNMSGRDLADELRKCRPRLKVVYMSGYPRDAVYRQGMEEGATFLSKPFGPRLLVEKVEELLRISPRELTTA